MNIMYSITIGLVVYMDLTNKIKMLISKINTSGFEREVLIVPGSALVLCAFPQS